MGKTKRKFWDNYREEPRDLAHHLKYPADYKHQIRCGYCSDIFGASRSNAVFCSSQCRQGHYRWAKKNR